MMFFGSPVFIGSRLNKSAHHSWQAICEKSVQRISDEHTIIGVDFIGFGNQFITGHADVLAVVDRAVSPLRREGRKGLLVVRIPSRFITPCGVAADYSFHCQKIYTYGMKRNPT